MFSGPSKSQAFKLAPRHDSQLPLKAKTDLPSIALAINRGCAAFRNLKHQRKADAAVINDGLRRQLQPPIEMIESNSESQQVEPRQLILRSILSNLKRRCLQVRLEEMSQNCKLPNVPRVLPPLDFFNDIDLSEFMSSRKLTRPRLNMCDSDDPAQDLVASFFTTRT